MGEEGGKTPKLQEVIVSRKTSRNPLECFSLHGHFVFMIINPARDRLLWRVFFGGLHRDRVRKGMVMMVMMVPLYGSTTFEEEDKIIQPDRYYQILLLTPSNKV